MLDGHVAFTEALPRYNYRLTDIQAALVRSQFGRFEDILSKKQKLVDVYLTELKHHAVRLSQSALKAKSIHGKVFIYY